MTKAVIQVKFFASLREVVGQAKNELAADRDSCTTVLEVWNAATDNMTLPENTLMAVNMDYVESSHSVNGGDEVAFFPPVTGG